MNNQLNNNTSFSSAENKDIVLVTGLTGFIGSHVSCELVKKGFLVVGISRSAKSVNPEFNKYVNENKIKVFSGNISNFNYNILPNPNYIIHIAGKVSAFGDMDDFMNINYYATERLLNYAFKVNPKCFIYFSSTAVYGYNGYVNLPETAEKKPFNNPYSISKLKTENLVQEYCKQNKLNFAIIRPGNVYGEYDYTSSHEIYTRIKNGKMLICAGGKYKSCFVYVKNLAKATLCVMQNENAYNTDYNVTDGNNETLKEIFSLVAKTFGVKSKLKNVPAFLSKLTATAVEGVYKLFRIKKAPLITKFSVWQNCADYSFSIEKIKNIGFEKDFSMEEGVKNTCNWINSLKEN